MQTMKSAKQLIVNADDFGYTHKVSEGIIRAHLEGIVSSATVMMNTRGVAQDIVRASEEAPDLALGVHLVFTSGRPLLPPEWVSSLVDESGHFHSQDALLEEPTRVEPSELKSELKLQVKTFENASGHAPDHIDCHHFVHVHPHLFEIYHGLALELDLPMRIPFVRKESQESNPLKEFFMRLYGSQEMIDAAARKNRERLAAQPVRGPDRFIVSFFGDNVSLDYLLNLLDQLPDGLSELMTHPGYNDEGLQSSSSYNVEREMELDTLTDANVKRLIAQLGIELTTYSVFKH